MPGGFEDYIAHFDTAKTAWLALYAAIGDLATKVSRVQQAPGSLAHPTSAAWSTQDELRRMLQDAEEKSAPLVIEFNRLPAAVQQYAPRPGTEKNRTSPATSRQEQAAPAAA
jgi:hypothetical protein